MVTNNDMCSAHRLLSIRYTQTHLSLLLTVSFDFVEYAQVPTNFVGNYSFQRFVDSL